MFNEYFDHIYYVNLERSVDRREKCESELAKYNIEAERIVAFDGEEENYEWNNKDSEMPGWNKYSAGLVHTTIKIIEDAKKNNYGSILIFEDDIQFHPWITKFVPMSLKALPNNWEQMFFAITNEHESVWVSKYLKQVKKGWCCQAYAMKSKVFDWYLEELRKIDRPIDAITVEIQENGKSFATHTNMVEHPPNISTIRGRLFDHSKEA